MCTLPTCLKQSRATMQLPLISVDQFSILQLAWHCLWQICLLSSALSTDGAFPSNSWCHLTQPLQDFLQFCCLGRGCLPQEAAVIGIHNLLADFNTLSNPRATLALIKKPQQDKSLTLQHSHVTEDTLFPSTPQICCVNSRNFAMKSNASLCGIDLQHFCWRCSHVPDTCSCKAGRVQAVLMRQRTTRQFACLSTKEHCNGFCSLLGSLDQSTEFSVNVTEGFHSGLDSNLQKQVQKENCAVPPRPAAAKQVDTKTGKSELNKTLLGMHHHPVAFVLQHAKTQAEKDFHGFVGEASCARWSFEKFKKQHLLGQTFSWLMDCSGLPSFSNVATFPQCT